MGACTSNLSEAEKSLVLRSKTLERNLYQESKFDGDKVKLLLLGAGESGKSTIFKQMKVIYGKTYTDAERKESTSIVYLNIIQTIKYLCNQVHIFELDGRIVAKASFAIVESLDESSDVDVATGDAIEEVWLDAAIQEVWSRRSEFQVIESIKYYFERINIIKMPDYLPTQDDILHSRVRTSGIVTEQYEIESVDYEMYDVGGQKNERKKWIHCFDNVTAVVFVAAISEYDQKLFEDQSVNRMIDALELFEEICGNAVFKNASILLFLNKKDLFEEKIKKIKIADTPMFNDYRGPPHDYKAGCNYFIDKFKSLNKVYKEREIYTNLTCATDTSNVRAVFDCCREVIMSQAFAEAGI